MDPMEELRIELNARRERILANPGDYRDSEFKYRTDELRRVLGMVARLQAKDSQPKLRDAA